MHCRPFARRAAQQAIRESNWKLSDESGKPVKPRAGFVIIFNKIFTVYSVSDISGKRYFFPNGDDRIPFERPIHREADCLPIVKSMCEAWGLQYKFREDSSANIIFDLV